MAFLELRVSPTALVFRVPGGRAADAVRALHAALMVRLRARAKRPQSPGEEIANSVIHGLGVLAVLAGAPFLILAAVERRSAWDVAGSSVFLASMLILYLSSTLYHALTHPAAKRVFHVLDHGAIYLLIAGTYTPFTLGALRGPWGWTLFGVVWAVAAVGITLKSRRRLGHPLLSNALYLGMGWLVLAAARPFWRQVGPAGLLWLLAGGLAYSGGVLFYTSRRRYAHALWHVCVLAGTVCHFFAVLCTPAEAPGAGPEEARKSRGAGA